MGNPDRRVEGRLTYNDADGIELRLIGSLHDLESVLARHTGPVISVSLNELFGVDREHIRIVGVTSEGNVTVDHCYRESGRFPLGGHRPAQEVYKGGIALLGQSFDDEENLYFTGVSTRIQHIEHWVGMSAVSVELERAEQSNTLQQLSLVTTPLQEMAIAMDHGELELAFEYGLAGDHIAESTIRQRAVFSIRFSEPQTLSDTIGFCTALQDLVTIGVNAPVSIDRVHLQHADLDRAISFFAKLIGPTGPEVTEPPAAIDQLFSFGDVGGLQGVAKWIAVADKYRSVVSALLSPEYRPPWYVEHRFFDAITSVESFARIQSREDHINRYKLKQLGHWVGAAFQDLVGDVDRWVDMVWDARRDNVVHRGLREAKRPQLYLLSESLYFLGLLSLIRECELPDRTLERIQKHSRFRRTADELRRAR